MKHETIEKIVRATIAEFIRQTEYNMDEHQSHVEKDFVWMDKTGRSEKATKIGSRRIQNTWDLNQIDSTTEQTLGGYVKSCRVGDVWKSRIEMLECLSIN